MSCIISSTCQFVDYGDKQYSYYTISNDGTIDGNLYNNASSITSLNVSKKYRIKSAHLLHKNDKYILNIIDPKDYTNLSESINFYDMTPSLDPSLTTLSDVISDFNSKNNNLVKDHKTFFIYVLDNESNYYVFGEDMLSKNITDLVPSGIKFCGLIEYLYNCKGHTSQENNVINISENEGCFINMDITKYLEELPTKISDIANIKLFSNPKQDNSTTNKNISVPATFSELFNNTGIETYNQNKLSATSIIVYFEETPNCQLSSSDTISVERYTEFVKDPNNNFEDKNVRMCAVNTIEKIFSRIQDYVEKMLLYKKINTTQDGFFLNDRKLIEKRMGDFNLEQFENEIGKYNTVYKMSYTAILITSILLFLATANKTKIKNYILMLLIIFMPYIFEFFMTLLRVVLKKKVPFSKIAFLLMHNVRKYLSIFV